MHASGIVVCSHEHPVIQLVEGLCCYHWANVVGPSTNDLVELSYHCSDLGPLDLFPVVPEFISDRLNCFFAGLDQEFPSRPCGLGSWVVPDVEAQEVEPFPEVDDACLFLRKGQAALFEPSSQDLLDLFGIFLCFTKTDEIISIPYNCSLSSNLTSAIIFNTDSFFHPV